MIDFLINNIILSIFNNQSKMVQNEFPSQTIQPFRELVRKERTTSMIIRKNRLYAQYRFFGRKLPRGQIPIR